MWVALGRAVLDMLEVTGTFLIKIVGKYCKNVSHCQTRKVLKTTHFDAFLFHRIRYFGTTGSVELDNTFLP